VAGLIVNSNSSNEVAASTKMPGSLTLSKLGIFISSNTIANTSTWRLRKNQANGNQSVTITASGTGYFEDSTNQDSVVAGDEVCYQLVTGAGTSKSLLATITSTLLTIPASDLPWYSRQTWFESISGGLLYVVKN
jgi:hypothetical protein